MRNRIRNFFMLLAFICLVVAAAGGNLTRMEAGSKDGNYYFSPCEVTKFQIKNQTLTLKVEKADQRGEGICTPSGKYKRVIKLKVAKNCKYREEYTSRREIEKPYSVKKSSYKKIKEIITNERAAYKKNGYASNFTASDIIVKNNKVVKIQYNFLY